MQIVPELSHFGTSISHGAGHSRLVCDSFGYLLDQCDAVKKSSSRYKKTPRQLVDRLYLSLKARKNDFLDTFEALNDGPKPHNEASWTAADVAVLIHCGPHYGRYLDALDQMLSCLKKIAIYLGISGEQAPWSKYRNPDAPHGRLPILAILASNDQWNRFATALCTVSGALGGELELRLVQISQANDRLAQVQRDSEEELNESHFQHIEDLRKHALATAEVFGHEHGFTCECPESHRVFWRVKDSFRLGCSKDDNGPQDDICSLVVESSTHRHVWVDFFTKSSDIEDASLAPEHTSRPQSPQSHAGDLKPVSTSIEGERVSQKRKNRKIGFLGLGSTKERKEVTMESREGKIGKKLPNIVAPIGADAEMGYCVYVQASSQVHFAATSGAQDNGAADIKLSGYASRLALKLNHEASDSAAQWAAVLSVRDILKSAEHLPLATEHRLQLAYKMASSIFYLHSTPWLSNFWDGRDVYLPYQNDGAVQIVDPLLARRFHRKRRRSTEPNDVTENEVAPLIPLIITRLGRFLLELSLGSSWSDIRRVFLAGGEAPGRSTEADQVIFLHILSWFENKKIAVKDKPCHNEGHLYFQAIQNCFLGNFGGSGDLTPSMDDDYIRRGVYEQILRPLQFALEDFQRRKSQLFGPPLKKIRQQHPASKRPSQTAHDMLFDDDELQDGDEKTAEKTKYANEWLKKYDDVLELAREVSPKRHEMPEHRIRVAILDTGFDGTHDLLRSAFRSRQLIYQDFVGPSTDVPRDDQGHGTHVTSIMLRMAPNVDIYVGRVSADGKTWKGSQVRKAIRWAVRKGVHIISMSFGFRDVDQSLESIRQAILEAHAADVLVFAAAGNGGPLDPVAFPACMDEVISVAATDGRGTPSQCNPKLRPGQRLCAIGEAIPAAWIRQPKQEKGEGSAQGLKQAGEEGGNEEESSHEDRGSYEDWDSDEYEDLDEHDQGHCQMVRRVGTSYATPVAAGIAAMILDFVWADRHMRLDAATSTTPHLDPSASIEGICSGTSQPIQGEIEPDDSYCPSVLEMGDMYEYKTLRTKRGMLTVFAHMINAEPGEAQSLSPSHLFRPLMSQPVDGNGNGILQRIIQTLRFAYESPVY